MGSTSRLVGRPVDDRDVEVRVKSAVLFVTSVARSRRVKAAISRSASSWVRP